jgi:DNA-binding transcriptional ArsR family regulator
MNIDIIKALADPSRLSLLKALGRCELCACVLPDLVKKKQPTVSSHLKILRKAGLVTMRKDGTKRMYSISPSGKRILGQIKRW